MKNELKLVVALTATMLAGCGSGGGSDVGDALGCLASAGLGCGRGQMPKSNSPYTFENWATLSRDQPTLIDANGVENYGGAQVFSPGAKVQYNQAGQPVGDFNLGYSGTILFPGSTNLPATNLSVVGQPSIDIGGSYFGSSAYGVLALIANPYASGWNYQSFGIRDNADPGSELFGAMSFGSFSPSYDPSGAANFTGKLAGFYLSAAGQKMIAAANFAVSVDYTNHTLSFSSTSTKLTSDLVIGTEAANLNFNGTLFYLSTQYNTGTLESVDGTMIGTWRGRFFGPSGQEFGGVLNLWSTTGTGERFDGAFGASR